MCMKKILSSLICVLLCSIAVEAKNNSRNKLSSDVGGAAGLERVTTPSSNSNKYTSSYTGSSWSTSNNFSASNAAASSSNNNKYVASSSSSNNNYVASFTSSNNNVSNDSVGSIQATTVVATHQPDAITGNGSTGTLATRIEPVSCPICNGAWFENKSIAGTGNSKTCGDLQESVQDVDQNSPNPQEQTWCRSNQLKAEEGGCCTVNTYKDIAVDIHDPCESLCPPGQVVSSSTDPVDTKVMGSHTCSSINIVFAGAVFSSGMCETIANNVRSTCCIAAVGRSAGFLRGAAEPLP